MKYLTLLGALVILSASLSCQHNKDLLTTEQLINIYVANSGARLSYSDLSLPEGNFILSPKATKKEIENLTTAYLAVHGMVIIKKSDEIVIFDSRKLKSKWHTTLTAGLEAAKTSSKPLLLKLTADWCSPCKLQEKDFFAMQQSSDSVIHRYELVEVDLSADFTQFEMLKKRGLFKGAMSLPTVILASTDLKESRQISGYNPADTAMDREKKYATVAAPVISSSKRSDKASF